jgi:transposase
MQSVRCEKDGLQIQLRRDRRFRPRCPECDGAVKLTRITNQVAFDLSCGTGKICHLSYPAEHGRCSQCAAYTTIRPNEIHPTCRGTWRLMRLSSQMARHMPCRAVAEHLEISSSTVRRYDQLILEHDLPEPDLDGLKVLLIDEKAVRKNHGYVTIVLNGESGELLHMDEGKKKASLESFFQKLCEAQKSSIQAVCIDRSGACQAVLNEQLPKASVVYDKFHLIANLNKALNEVRKDQYNKAKKEDKNVIKGQRFNLMRNPENLSEAGGVRLDKLLKMNEKLNVAYILKEAFSQVWDYVSLGWAKRYLNSWIEWVRESNIQPLVKFANGVGKVAEQVVSYCRHPITNGRIEGFNSTIARVVHKARGVGNLDYLFLKLRQESLAAR